MPEKLLDNEGAAIQKPTKPVQRLCNEIQLFDLCELEKCSYKQGLHCASADLLNRFEAIAEEDERPPVARFESDEYEAADVDDDGYDDACEGDEFGDESYEEDE